MRASTPLSLALLLLTMSCGDRNQGMSAHRESIPLDYVALYEGAPRLRSASSVSIPAYEADDSSATSGFALTGTMVIRTAQVAVEVDSLDAAIAAVRETAARFGGFVAGFARNSAGSWRPTATLTVRVPVQQLDAAVEALSALGHAESVKLASQDVGEEFVDVTARLENSRRLERRLLELLGRRTGQLKDVLQVEEALARVREEIERVEGRRRYLQSRSEMATVELLLHEDGPAAGPRVSSTAGEAFGQAWRNFLVLTSTAIAASGVFVPLGLLAAGAWVAVRRSRRRATSTQPATL